MAGATVVISVLADAKKFTKGMGDIGKSTDGLLGKLSSIGKGIAAIGAAGALAIGAWLGASFAAVAEIERLNAQTQAAIASTEGAAGRSLDQLLAHADALERLTGVEAESIQAGQNLLLTFTNIQGTNFDAATQAALDMSVALGTDMTSAATLVGKALNDPIAGLSALSRVGVQLTDEQKALIESLVAVGDTAGAQAVILAELNRQFGGSAEAFGETFKGTLEKVKNSFGTIGETIVAGFLPVATEVLGKVNDLFLSIGDSPAFQAAIDSISGFVLSLLQGGEGASVFADAFAVASAVLNPFGLVIQALAPLLPQLAGSFAEIGSVVGGALVQSLPLAATLIEQIVTILSGTLAVALPPILSLVAELAAVFGGVLAAALPVAVGLISQLAGIFTTLLPILMPVVELLGGVLVDAVAQLGPILTVIADVLGTVLSTALTALAPLLTMLAETLAVVLTAAAPLIPAVLSLVSAFLPIVELAGTLIGAILPPLAELLVALLTPILALVGPLLGMLAPAIQFVADVLGFLIGIVVQVVTAFIGLITGSEEAQAGVEAVWNNVLDFFGGIPDAIGNFFAAAGDWLVSAGSDIINGLLGGLQDAIGAVWSWIEETAGGIADTFANVLGIQSPSRVMRDLAKWVPKGIAIGLADDGSIVRAMGNLSGLVTDGFDPNPSAQLVGVGYGAARGGNTYQINLPVGMPSAEAGRAIKEAIEEYERLNGGNR